MVLDYFIPSTILILSCLFLAANGEATIHVYDMRSDGKASLCAPCTVPGEPMAGITMLPKQSCNVKNVEFSRMLRCTKTAVQPISFQVPRSNDMLEYFQDDIFVPTRSCRANDMMDIPKYLTKQGCDPNYIEFMSSWYEACLEKACCCSQIC